ncbi:MBL fold metallo-hydrolase [Thermosulfuriphilus sp.]
MIIHGLTLGPFEVRCYIVACKETKEALVIDPAAAPELIHSRLLEEGLNLRYIVNTHGHADHTAANSPLKRLTGALIAMHEDDDDFFRRPENYRLFEAWGFGPNEPADIRLKEGDRLIVGTVELRVIHTPGHSPGSICLYGRGVLFTGDTLFVGAVGRTDLPGGNFETLLRSIKEKILPLPAETVIHPGHDYGEAPTSTLAREKKTNPYIVEFILGR